MLENTDGLAGPVMVNRLGKPCTMSPRYVRVPFFHFSFRVSPSCPSMSTATSAPVMASNPVANTMVSNSNSSSLVRMPVGVISTSGVRRRLTSRTFSRSWRLVVPVSRHGRLVPSGWSNGQRSSAVCGSFTIARMRSRTYSQAVSLASLLVSRSLKASSMPTRFPDSNPTLYTASRSSLVASNADFVGSSAGTPNPDTRAAARWDG